MQFLLNEQLAEQPKRAAVVHLKKLAHPADKNQMPVRLPPRRLRREAARVLTKEALREHRAQHEHSTEAHP